MSAQFQTLPPDKRYPGRTQYRAPDGRVFVCMGVGEQAERVLLARAGERRDGE